MADFQQALAGIRGVLFDLDGTLLQVEMNRFIPVYIGGPGLAPEECLMVGNDAAHDLAARKVGIPTFRVDTWLENRCNGLFASDFRGSHSDLYRLVGQLGAGGPTN